MIRIKLPSLKSDAVKVEFETRDSKIGLFLRPYTGELDGKIDKKHTKADFVKDADTRQMVKVETVDRKAALDEKIDYLLYDVEGLEIIDEETGLVIPNTDLRAKKAIAFMDQPVGERPIFNFIMETCRELAFTTEEEKKTEIKNS